MNTVNEDRLDPVEAGAPTDEIEITPEMIRAGVEACSLWSACDLDEWKAIDIYRQMERARRATAASSEEKWRRVGLYIRQTVGG